MMTIKLVCVGKLKERYYADAAEEFLKRLTGFCKIQILELTEQRLPEDPSDAEIQAALEKEAAVIADKTKGFFIIALCVEGGELDSRAFAGILSDCAVRGISRLCFVVGGSYGLHESIKDRAEKKLSMSRMTFPHHLARVILLEQIYRAFTIIEGGKYHK